MDCECWDILAYLWEGCRILPHPQRADSCVPPKHFLDTAPAWVHCLCNAPHPATHGLNPCQNVPGPMPLLHHYKEKTQYRRIEGLVWWKTDVLTGLDLQNIGCWMLYLFYLEKLCKPIAFKIYYWETACHAHLWICKHCNTNTALAYTRNAHTNISKECSVAKYAYLCGTRIHAGTMSLIHYLTPRCSLLLAPLSVCPNGKNTSHTFGDRERDRRLDTHINASQLPTLSFCHVFSTFYHTHSVFPLC